MNFVALAAAIETGDQHQPQREFQFLLKKKRKGASINLVVEGGCHTFFSDL
jgi:hypothetical protein